MPRRLTLRHNVTFQDRALGAEEELEGRALELHLALQVVALRQGRDEAAVGPPPRKPLCPAPCALRQ